MLDSMLRPAKDRLLTPLGGVTTHVHPIAWTGLAIFTAIGAALAAWQAMVVISVAAWLLSRVFDGLDGLVARSTDRQSDLGGLLDFVGDSIAYAVVPLGIAAAVDDRATWIATSVVVASFYVNAVSFGYVAALIEKRRPTRDPRCKEPTSTTAPRGLVEGFETITVFTLALAVPDAAPMIWWVMAAAVTVTIVERMVWAFQMLRTPPCEQTER